MKEGSVSIVTYANKLANLPLTLAVMLITIYIYPAMTRLAGDTKAFHAYLGRISRLVVILALPVVIVCWFEGGAVATIAYGVSRLTASEVEAVGMLFSIYMAGILFLILRDLANRYFYARTSGYGVMIVTAVFVILNFALSYVLVPVYGLNGLAIAMALAAAGAFALQFWLALGLIGPLHLDMRFILVIALSAGAMIALFMLAHYFFAPKDILSSLAMSLVAGLFYLVIFLKGYGFSFMTNLDTPRS